MQTYVSRGVDVAEVGSDAGRAPDVVQPEVGHVLVKLEEEREGLADASCESVQKVDRSKRPSRAWRERANNDEGVRDKGA